ncbi:unnamed protein product [Mesocestoides corti]|uniref:Uncharacterized protein n=1 Tax=Mesocestoides corti TaxID=53468 RepID=A0A0R3U5I6_MESCO|nr:unnamed protein product [Mesocestoides corti]
MRGHGEVQNEMRVCAWKKEHIQVQSKWGTGEQTSIIRSGIRKWTGTEVDCKLNAAPSTPAHPDRSPKPGRNRSTTLHVTTVVTFHRSKSRSNFARDSIHAAYFPTPRPLFAH